MTSLPERLWQVIKAWLDAKKTGSITLHMREGKIFEIDKYEKERI